MSRPPGHPANTLGATIASHISWANTTDRSARTAAAREKFRDRFVEQAREQFGELPDAELARRAEHLRKAYYARLALKSAQARRRARQSIAEAEAAERELAQLGGIDDAA